jgi:hypothetical protein
MLISGFEDSDSDQIGNSGPCHKRPAEDWRCSSSSRLPALQVWSTEVKPQSHQKKKRKNNKIHITHKRPAEPPYFTSTYIRLLPEPSLEVEGKKNLNPDSIESSVLSTSTSRHFLSVFFLAVNYFFIIELDCKVYIYDLIRKKYFAFTSRTYLL